MPNYAKAFSLIRQLYVELEVRLPAYYLTESGDAQGAILIISSDATPVAGDQTVAIRILGESTAFVNSIGLPQAVYAPMVAQVIEEQSTIAGSAVLSLVNELIISEALSRMGVRQQRYLNPNGTVPSASEFNANGTVNAPAVLITSYSPDVNWPLAGQ
jgi:hypothetical protein